MSHDHPLDRLDERERADERWLALYDEFMAIHDAAGDMPLNVANGARREALAAQMDALWDGEGGKFRP